MTTFKKHAPLQDKRVKGKPRITMEVRDKMNSRDYYEKLDVKTFQPMGRTKPCEIIVMKS